MTLKIIPSFKNAIQKLSVLTQICNPREAEAGGFRVRGQPELPSKFCLEKTHIDLHTDTRTFETQGCHSLIELLPSTRQTVSSILELWR